MKTERLDYNNVRIESCRFEDTHGVVEQHLKVVTWAPVCRSGWLVEAECMAIRKHQ